MDITKLSKFLDSAQFEPIDLTKFTPMVRRQGHSLYESNQIQLLWIDDQHNPHFMFQGNPLCCFTVRASNSNHDTLPTNQTLDRASTRPLDSSLDKSLDKPSNQQIRSSIDPSLEGSCSCKKKKPCMHLWGALLYANDEGLFDLPSITSLRPKSSISLPNWKLAVTHSQVLIGKSETSLNAIKNRLQIQNKSKHSRVGYYAFDLSRIATEKVWSISFYVREFGQKGKLGRIKRFLYEKGSLSSFQDPLDQLTLLTLGGTLFGSQTDNPYAYWGRPPRRDNVLFPDRVLDTLLEKLSQAEKLIAIGFGPMEPIRFLSFDANKQAKISLELTELETQDCVLRGTLSVDSEVIPLDLINGKQMFYLKPYLLYKNKLFVADADSIDYWIHLFMKQPEISVPQKEVNGFLDYFYKLEGAPDLKLPESFNVKEQTQFSKVRLSINSTKNSSGKSPQFVIEVSFLYGEEFVSLADPRDRFYDIPSKTFFVRNRVLEANEANRLQTYQISTDAQAQNLGGSPVSKLKESEFLMEIEGSQIRALVVEACSWGWQVVAFKRTVVGPKTYEARLDSGIDWFDLSAQFEFDNGFILSLPELLRNIKKGMYLIPLADGTTGVLDEEWIRRFEKLGKSGTPVQDGVRLTKIQALFLASELEDDKCLQVDQKFKTFRKLIDDVNNIDNTPIDEGFKGVLRSYQRKGYSWLDFMTKNNIGAVLADDMGLGKTIQILALLAKDPMKKTLIVAPKSLVFNWINEASKFTPHLRFHDHTGLERHEAFEEEFDDAQVIVTTYNTLRIDIDFFKRRTFDFFILDEAHNIKNCESQAYMAARMVKATMKIALTGTPVENSIGDLFSILSVVTPGLISSSLAEKYEKETEPEALEKLARALKPFILRRTKDAVLKDLPEKSEQVIYCELSKEERKQYNDLKAFYWRNLNTKIENKGLKKSKIEVLEALLRLRQAACHGGLLQPNLVKKPSSKFQVLLEQIEEVIAEGHKVLVFSQFVQLLSLLRTELDQRKVTYEYLDGQVNRRGDRVENFQTNDSVRVFLISLKAGGVGLNLTSADYVFILDPWWNPAAESQAIDRVHRIGQRMKVFAYKIIAKDTVEEKILALQEQKRAIANAVISTEKSFLKGLRIEDLQELFA